MVSLSRCGQGPHKTCYIELNNLINHDLFVRPMYRAVDHRTCRRGGTRYAGTTADTHTKSRIRSDSLPPVRLPRGQRERMAPPLPGGASRGLPGSSAMCLCHPKQPDKYNEL